MEYCENLEHLACYEKHERLERLALVSSQNTQTKSHIENKSYRKSRTGFKAKILKTESNSK